MSNYSHPLDSRWNFISCSSSFLLILFASENCRGKSRERKFKIYIFFCCWNFSTNFSSSRFRQSDLKMELTDGNDGKIYRFPYNTKFISLMSPIRTKYNRELNLMLEKLDHIFISKSCKYGKQCFFKSRFLMIFF